MNNSLRSIVRGFIHRAHKFGITMKKLSINDQTHRVTLGVYGAWATPSSTTGGPPFSCPAFVRPKGVGIEIRNVRCIGACDDAGGSIEGTIEDGSASFGRWFRWGEKGSRDRHEAKC